MRIKFFLAGLIIVLAAVLTYQFVPENVVTYPPGMLVSDVPLQTELTTSKVWGIGDYQITALSGFRLKARVLHRKKYSSGHESDLSPIDLAFGWRELSDQNVIDKIDFDQHGRWYFWKTKHYPVPKRVIETNSANMHMIPADDDISETLTNIQVGQIVQISGFLVAIKATDGWKWHSSLSREDTGSGACEIVWVEKIAVE